MNKIYVFILIFLARISSKVDRLILNLIRKNRLRSTPAYNLKKEYYSTFDLLWLVEKEKYEIKSIFDIGAHHGYWTILAKSFFPNSKVYLFEPISEHMVVLKKNTSSLSNLNYYNIALGSTSGSINLNIATDSDSSSILDFHTNIYNEFKQTIVDKKEIQIKCVSELIANGELEIPDLIKLDIQGYELLALIGFGDYLKSVKYIIIEVSFIELYVNQPSLSDIISFLDKNQFALTSISELRGFSKKIIQTDMLFVNKGLD